MWTDCCLYFPLSKDLVRHRPNFCLTSFNVSLPCASRVLGQRLQRCCWLPNKTPQLGFFSKTLGDRTRSVPPDRKELFRGRQPSPEQCGKAMLNDHQQTKQAISHPLASTIFERGPMLVYTLHLVRLLASTL